jgi:hypothetical protein
MTAGLDLPGEVGVNMIMKGRAGREGSGAAGRPWRGCTAAWRIQPLEPAVLWNCNPPSTLQPGRCHSANQLYLQDSASIPMCFDFNYMQSIWIIFVMILPVSAVLPSKPFFFLLILSRPLRGTVQPRAQLIVSCAFVPGPCVEALCLMTAATNTYHAVASRPRNASRFPAEIAIRPQ